MINLITVSAEEILENCLMFLATNMILDINGANYIKDSLKLETLQSKF